MSEQYPGGFISKTPPIVQTDSAQGIWTTSQLSQYKQAGYWPVSVNLPDAPIIGTVVLDYDTGLAATIPFTAPAYNGGLSIISYTANSSTGNLSNTIVQSGSGSITISGLTANTNYTFTVTDKTLVGQSSNSAVSNIITSGTIPNAPTITNISIRTTNALISIAAPSSNGRSRIISYTANSSADGLSNTIFQAESGTIGISGLTSGSVYTFTATCDNIIGRSSPSTVSTSITALPELSNFGAPRTISSANTEIAVSIAKSSTTGLYVAILSNAPNLRAKYTSSTDGITWTDPKEFDRLLSLSSPPYYGYGITFSGTVVEKQGVFVFSGHGRYEATGLLAHFTTYSTDGITWATQKLGGYAPVIFATAVNANTGNMISVGADFGYLGRGSNYLAAYTTSTDGITWSSHQLNTTAVSPILNVDNGSNYYDNVWLRTVCFGVNSSLCVAGGEKTDSLYNEPYQGFCISSTDNITWARSNITGTASIRGVASGLDLNNNEIFVAIGYSTKLGDGPRNNSEHWPMFATSTNGITWSSGTAINGSKAKLTSVSYDPISKQFVAVGYNILNQAVFTTSVTGTDWSKIQLLNGDSLFNPYTVYNAGNNQFITLGNSKNNANNQLFYPQICKGLPDLAIGGSAPSVPTIGTVTLSGGLLASIPVTAPYNGGNAITGFVAISSPEGCTGYISGGGGGTITVNNLRFGTTYTFKVYALNAKGQSPAATSNAVTTRLAPTIIGESVGGGYFAGNFTSNEVSLPGRGTNGFNTYAIIVAPKATGEAYLAFSNFSMSNTSSSEYTGYSNTKELVYKRYDDTNITPAAWFCNSLTIGGYTDWYLPAYRELIALRNLRSNPMYQTGGSEVFTGTPYSNQFDGTYWSSSFYVASLYNDNTGYGVVWEYSQLSVRAIRRIQID